jgi:hypothetical protein
MIAAETLVELEDLVCPGCGGAVLAEPPTDALSQEFSHNDGSCVEAALVSGLFICT